MNMVERNRQIVADLQAGVLHAALSRRYGVSPQRISQIARKAGLPKRRRPISEAVISHAVALMADGMSLRKTARFLGMDCGNLRCALARRGVPTVVGERKPPWSDDEEAFLRKYYLRRGWPAIRIAANLHRSRNSVIAKAYRLGLGMEA